MEFDILQTENYIHRSLREKILSHIQEPNLSDARTILARPYVSVSSRQSVLEMVSHLPLSPRHEFLRLAEKFITPGTVVDFTRAGVTFRNVNCETEFNERELEALARKLGLKLWVPH